MEKLCSLEKLNLNGVKITELPLSIGNMKSLKILLLKDTDISSLPNSFVYLSSLEKLDLSGTKITHFPECISKLSTLASFRFSNGAFEEEKLFRGSSFLDDDYDFESAMF
jgi:Leucine-rich repeat (LRR) protein